MVDQNEMSKMSEPQESVLLPDASAEKATQAPDTDHLHSLAFSCSHSCTYQLVCIQKEDQGHDPARILTVTCNLAIDKGGGEGM